MKKGGTKDDGEKIRVELISPMWLLGIAKVLTFGAKKYAAHNWRKGIEISRLIGAALRHILAFLMGEDIDPDSGLPHLHCASCELMFASELVVTRPDLDDRYKPEPTGGVKNEICSLRRKRKLAKKRRRK